MFQSLARNPDYSTVFYLPESWGSEIAGGQQSEDKTKLLHGNRYCCISYWVPPSLSISSVGTLHQLSFPCHAIPAHGHDFSPWITGGESIMFDWLSVLFAFLPRLFAAFLSPVQCRITSNFPVSVKKLLTPFPKVF